MCEEFGCLPSQLDGESPELLFRIMQLRAYRDVDEAMKHVDKQEDVPNTPMVETWAEVQQRRLMGG